MQAHFFENNSGLKSLLEKVNHLKSELDALRPLNAEQEARVMQQFRLDWNYHSNSIEGNSLTYGETIAFLMEGLTAKGKPFKDHLDIRGHNEAINYLMDMVKNRQELTEKTIRELHSIILVEPYKTPAQTSDGQRVEKTVTLGAYKKMPNHVKTPTGEIHYYATPEETPAKMADLMSWLHEEQGKNELHPLAIAAIFHYRFVAIHPFDDGNGRMSRLLMNLILMQYGYPPVVIKQEERNLYYNALRQADSGDLGAFVEFIGDNLIHALEIYLRGAKGESIEEDNDLDKEIALLKVRLSGKKDLIRKSQEVIYQLLHETIYPLFKDTYHQCLKLNDLFLNHGCSVHFSSETKKLSSLKWHDFNEAILKHQELKNITDFQIISFNYAWRDFKKGDEPFNVACSLSISLDDFEYDLTFHGKHENIYITSPYYSTFSAERAYQLSTVFVKEALAEIHDKVRD